MSETAPHRACIHAAPVPHAQIFDAPTIRAFAAPHEVTQLLEAAVDLANLEARRLEHTLISGPHGCGKHVLARAVMRELAEHSEEIDGECIENLDHLMELVRSLRARHVLLIRNVDRMAKRAQRHLAVMLGEGRAPRAAKPVRQRFAERDPDAPRERVADFTLIATASLPTTILPALRRRLELVVALQPPTLAERRAAVRRALAAQGLRALPGALEQLAEQIVQGSPGSSVTIGAMGVACDAESVVRAAVICARVHGGEVVAQALPRQ